MARPLRAIYANVAVTFSQSNVSTVSDAITFGSHSFVNGAIVVYSSTSPIGGLTNNATYYVKKHDSYDYTASNYVEWNTY